MYINLLILPLLSVFICNRKLGIKSINLSIIMMGILVSMMLIIVYENTDILLNLGTWFQIGNYNILWNFRYDSITRVMIIPIILVSFLVQLYSSIYLKGDPHIVRYFSYLNLFTFQMLILVTADHFLILFIGWEGVGLASYLLVNFWYTRLAANMASLKAFLMNRIGDWGLSIGIILWLTTYYDSNSFLYFHLSSSLFSLLSFFLIIGAIAKSAQLGLHTWLTSAMEGKLKIKSNDNITTTYDDINSYQKEAILGLILSDGSISKSSPRLQFTFKADSYEFCKWLKFNILGSISSLT
jgi:NADH-ubiquinone oxidoreductase chain 5